jgi:outer membrane lipopolysaccharide assembly protein LptE/RlpB
VLTCASILLLCGCGYQLVGKETHIPPGVTSIAIPTFVNATLEPGLEIPFTQAFRREFIFDRRIKVVDSKEADSILTGVIKSFNSITSVAYDAAGFATEYQATAVVDLVLKRRSGEILWIENNLSDIQWYRASSSGVVNEANKNNAAEQIAETLGERARDRFFYNF